MNSRLALKMNNNKTGKPYSWNESLEANAKLALVKCILISIEEATLLRDISFWLDGITILVVASCGILLNIPVIFFFVTKRNMKGLFNVCSFPCYVLTR